MSQPPFPPACKDCVHARRKSSTYQYYYVCVHPEAQVLVTTGDVVDGFQQRRSHARACEVVRADESRCGQAGRWWVHNPAAVLGVVELWNPLTWFRRRGAAS